MSPSSSLTSSSPNAATTHMNTLPSLPLDRLPPELSLYLMDHLSSACDPASLLNLMSCNKDMYDHFSKVLYRDLILDKKNAWNVCLGIDWSLESEPCPSDTPQEAKARDVKTSVIGRIKRLWKHKDDPKGKSKGIVPKLDADIPALTFPPVPPPFGLDILSIHHRKVQLLNYVQSLYISDLESATYIAKSLGPEILTCPKPGDPPLSIPQSPPKTFSNVKTVSLDVDLMKAETSFFGSKIGGLLMGLSWDQAPLFDPYAHPNPGNTLYTLSHILRPTHMCSTWCQGLERPWDCTFFWRMRELVANWNLKSFTWHSTAGLIDPGRDNALYPSDDPRAVTCFFPPNIPVIRAFNHTSLMDRCGGPSGEECECRKALRGVLIYLTLQDWENEESNEARRVELIGYPCLMGIGVDDLLEAVVESQRWLDHHEVEIERAKRDWIGRRDWLERKFRILEVDEADGCVCCGRK
ncbi:hypothetical protein I302_100098 [Kwoniella bestiolae CBS 10118]|uniref:Uncharacterized protein n=1 Tax=Kwoniella bestiolae CBS 10118 TaxID=1296100 RepID=A0A1B9G483_9TREE|nr:hypothetical protein I302_03471 [Kwoniella bestiolae CBS 10118]OCF25798.1 hypothetical protein I302_03471 [Kwoniella bestiolae CBS 10118]